MVEKKTFFSCFSTFYGPCSAGRYPPGPQQFMAPGMGPGMAAPPAQSNGRGFIVNQPRVIQQIPPQPINVKQTTATLICDIFFSFNKNLLLF
jgi:hypothetical protein